MPIDPVREQQVTLRWVWHTKDFASLRVGRIELAQISKAASSEIWFYTLRFGVQDERRIWSEPTQIAAMHTAEKHAERVITDEASPYATPARHAAAEMAKKPHEKISVAAADLISAAVHTLSDRRYAEAPKNC